MGQSLFHPDDRILQAFVDGEIKESQSQKVLSHLEWCERCRQNVSQRKAAWFRFQELDKACKAADESLILSDGLDRILSKIQKWQITHAPKR